MPSRFLSFRLAELIAAAALVAAGAGASAAFGAPAGALAASANAAASSATTTTTTALAPVDTGGPRWTELNGSQRRVLAPLVNDWNGLDVRSKERWLAVAGRFHKMPPDEQQRATTRMAEWSHMTVAERTRARMNFQALRSVSKEERDARWKAYQALPEDQKRELARQAAAAAIAQSQSQPHRRAQAASDAASAPRRAFVAARPASGVAGPGVTTTLLTRRAMPPAHQRDGQPKIAAGPRYVDNNTLLPKRPASAAAKPASAARAGALPTAASAASRP